MYAMQDDEVMGMRSRVSYSKEHRGHAKDRGAGMVTIDYVRPDGMRHTAQFLAGPKLLRYIKSVMKRTHTKTWDEDWWKGRGRG